MRRLALGEPTPEREPERSDPTEEDPEARSDGVVALLFIAVLIIPLFGRVGLYGLVSPNARKRTEGVTVIIAGILGLVLALFVRA